MLTLVAPCSHELEIKKSRFLALAAPAATVEDALGFVARNRDPAANHNCWAYKVGPAWRFSDDGEPKGTAGKPILAAIERQGLDGVVVVVTRFFGGIKLGSGGLARAYGGSAAECLRVAPKRELKRLARAGLLAPFELLGAVYPLLERHGARKTGEDFTGEGARLALELDADAFERLRGDLLEATAGRVELRGEEAGD